MTPATAASLIRIITAWTARTESLRALALLGSWARHDARADSDLDLLVLMPGAHSTEQLDLGEIGLEAGGYTIRSVRCVPYGAVISQVLDLEPPAEVELSFAELTWAKTAPVDAETAAVVRGGFQILVDKDGALRRLVDAVGV